MAIKVAMIGAGSIGFTRRLLHDILAVPKLADTRFAFTDISARNLDMVTRLYRCDIAANELPATIDAMTDRRDALADANYVICTIRQGGIEAFESDIDIPLTHGVDQCVGDTLCACGLMYAQRTIPTLRDICRDIRAVAKPGVPLLNYANPMDMNTWACHTYCGVPTIGLCMACRERTGRSRASSSAGPRRRISSAPMKRCTGAMSTSWLRGSTTRPGSSTSHGAASTWFRASWSFSRRTLGTHGHGRRRCASTCCAALATTAPSRTATSPSTYPGTVSARMRLRAGSISPPGSTARRAATCACASRDAACSRPTTRVGWPKIRRASRLRSAARSMGRTSSRRWRPGGCTAATSTWSTGGTSPIGPTAAWLRSPGYVDKTGVNMPVVGALSLACAATCAASVRVQEMGMESAVRGDATLLKQAMLHDPLVGAVCDPEEVWQMTDELLVAQAEWLPQYRDEIPAARERLARAERDGTRVAWGGSHRAQDDRGTARGSGGAGAPWPPTGPE